MIRILPAAATISALALLTACSPAPDSSGSAATTADTVPTDVTTVADETPTPAPDAAPPPEAATKADETTSEKSEGTLTSFPAKFQGRWGINAADCDPKRADNKGLMTIKASEATFYESRAKIKSGKLAGDALDVDWSWTGEGQTWDTHSVLTLSDGGKTLSRADADPVEAVIYKKCSV